VRHAITSSRIAVGTDGQIDPEVSDRQWEQTSTRAKAEKAPRGLAAARNRQGRARLAALETQVEELRGPLAPPGVAQKSSTVSW
jgi:hypothetical protein